MGLVALAALAVVPRQATAFIYWADPAGQTVGRAENDGSGATDNFIKTGKEPVAVAIDGAHIYWANQQGNSIGRANLDGSGVDNGFISGITEPSGVAVTSTSVYWSTIPGPIGHADIDGSNKFLNFITGATLPCGLAVDSGHIYWGDIATGAPAYIGRAGLSGSEPQPKYVTIPEAIPCGVAVNSSNIFWSEPGLFAPNGTRIGRANITGLGPDASFIGNLNAPCGLALDGASHLYWANLATGTIGRANTDGTGVVPSLFATGAAGACGIAINSLSSPPAPPPPPAVPTSADTTPPQTKIAKGPGKKLAKGKAKFSLSSTEAGSRFECKLDKAKPKPCRTPKSYAGLKPGSHAFRAWAIDAAGNKDPTPAKRSFRVPPAAS